MIEKDSKKRLFISKKLNITAIKRLNILNGTIINNIFNQISNIFNNQDRLLRRISTSICKNKIYSKSY